MVTYLHPKPFLQIVILTMGFYSCTTTHVVSLKSNGTAQITIDRTTAFVEKLETSPLISNIDTSNNRANFTIHDIDSIGQYMPFHNPGFLRFQDYGDSISVTTGNNKPYKTKPRSCCHLAIRVTTEKPMDAFDSNGKKLKSRKDQDDFLFRQSIRQQVKGKRNIDIILKTSNNSAD